MDPYKAVAGQAVSVSILLSIAWLFAPGSVGYALMSVTLLAWVVGVALCIGYLWSRGHASAVRPSRWRNGGDSLSLIEISLPCCAIGAALLVHGPHGPLTHSPAALELSTVFGLLGTMLSVVLASSMVDWFYIRPRRDGLVRLPPCMSSGDPRWAAITKSWIQHRLVAEASFVVFFIITGPIVVIEAYFLDTNKLGWISKVIGPLLTIFGIPFGYNKRRLDMATAVIPGANSPSRFALGDTISWKTPRQTQPKREGERVTPYLFGRRARLVIESRRERARPIIRSSGEREYLFDVSQDEVTLFRLSARRSKDQPFYRGYKAPLSALMTPGAITNIDNPSPCANGCIAMHARCARRTTPGTSR